MIKPGTFVLPEIRTPISNPANGGLPFLLVLLVFLSLPGDHVSAQTFQDFLSRVRAAPEAQRGAVADSFMNAVPTVPFVEGDTLVHFIYYGRAGSVCVAGDANNWNPATLKMTNVAGTDLWYYTASFEPDARLEYKIVLDGTTWILDPRNSFQAMGGFGPNSELRMPAYVPPAETEFYSDIPHGGLHDTTFFSTNLGNVRTIRVYTPPRYETGRERYPVTLFHDGLEYITLARADYVLDYLISQNRIRPLIAVFVPPVSSQERSREYSGDLQDAFTAFIVEEVVPWVDVRYRTLPVPENRGVVGASNGGNIALWLGLNHPEVFGHIAAQSSNVEPNVAGGFQNKPKLNLQIYLDLGRYDLPILIQRVHDFLPILQAKGYRFRFLEFHEGHAWGNWRAHLDNALETFFPGKAVKVGSTSRMPRNLKDLEPF